MTSPNHIAGGTLFTGFWCSLYDINIFDDWRKVTAVALFSLLPDIDLPKSPIGFALYPLSNFLHKKYGHRTATHSILFLLLITTACYILGKFSGLQWLYIIAFWAILGHLLLDMITLQGVPLFYPFMKNPCVLPANPEFRISTSNYRTEIIAFGIFVLLNFTSLDLYANGFWTTWNQTFSTLDHVNREAHSTDVRLLVKYHISDNGNDIKSIGWLLESAPDHCFVVDTLSREVVKIDQKDPTMTIFEVQPIRSKIKAKSVNKAGFAKSIEELNAICRGRYVQGSIKSNLPIYITNNGFTEKKSNALFKYDFSPHFMAVTDSVFDNIQAQIKIKRLQLQEHILKFRRDSAKYETRKIAMNIAKDAVQKYDPKREVLKRSELEQFYFKVKAEFEALERPIYVPPTQLIEEINQLNQKHHISVIDIQIYYELNYPILP